MTQHELQFHSLNLARHYIDEEFVPDLFTPNSSNPHFGNEYWTLSALKSAQVYFKTGLHGQLALPNSEIFDTPTVRDAAKTLSKKSNDARTPFHLFMHHTIPTETRYPMRNNKYSITHDMQLSRFACWVLAGQTSNDPFAATYFLMPGVPLSELETQTDKINRINLRAQIAQHEKILNGIIKGLDGNHRIIHHKKQRAFFYFDTDQIRHHYGIPSDTPLTDYMPTNALREYLGGLERTIIQFNHTTHRTITELNNILSNEMMTARKHLMNKNQYPEHNLTKIKVNDIQSEYNKLTKEFIKQYGLTFIK